MSLGSSIADLLKRLTGLKPVERAAVRRHLGALDKLDGTDQAAAEAANGPSIDDWLLDGLYATLADRGLAGTNPPRYLLPKLKSWKHYSENCPQLRTWLENHASLSGEQPLSRTEKIILGQVVAEAYIDFVDNRLGDSSMSRLLSCIDYLPRAIDQAFPGYTEAWMLRAILGTRRNQVLTP